MSKLVEVYRNSVQAWECDQMGHLNVQFYLEKAALGLTVLGHKLGLGPTSQALEGARLFTREYHVRFHREQRAGAPLCIEAGILEIHETHFKVYLELKNPATNETAATLVVQAELHRPESAERLPLPHHARDAARALQIELPDYAAPRGLELRSARTPPSLSQAASMNMLQTYLGPVVPAMCDPEGGLADRSYMGIISDAVPNLLAPTRRVMPEDRSIGGAALEYRLVFHTRPKAGNILCLRSGIKTLGEKAYTLGHCLFDYQTGEAVASSEAVAVMFDLQARRAVPIPELARTALAEIMVPEFSI